MQQAIVHNPPKSVGRPTVMTDDTVANLCQSLQKGFSIPAACNWARIDRSTFYRHFNSDPIFATKVTSSIMFLYLASTEIIYKKIVYEKDPKLAMWYLEKVDPERYAGKKFCRKCHNLQKKYNSRHTYYEAKDPYCG